MLTSALTIGKANVDVFAETLLQLAQENQLVFAVTSDSRGSSGLVTFGNTLPAQLVEVGIAEQNLVGIAAGLASTGKSVFAISPACFLTSRALEQIKVDVAYSDNPVKVVGISAGVSYGALGSTHHSLHDIAVLRSINNIDVVVPADSFETREVIRAAVTHPRPIYIRFGKRAMHHLHVPEAAFSIGKAITLIPGTDVTFIATGETVETAYMAAMQLRAEGVECRVISMHTVKPLDTEVLLAAARETQAILTIEEHSVCGGLGEACAAVLVQHGASLPFRIIGIPDEPTVTGSQLDIYRHYGITSYALADAARVLLRDKGNP